MPSPDPDIRRHSAVKAGCISAASKSQAQHDAAMANARAAQLAAIAREIDPDGSLAAADPAELHRQVDLHRRARLADMSLKAAQARARRRRQTAPAGAA